MAEGPPKLPLEGHIALITGASGGIGVATARLLASLGCSIAIHYNSDKETATFLQDELRLRYDNNLNANFIVAKADMGEYSEVRAMHAAVAALLGAPTILINNAGSTCGRNGVKTVADLSIEDFEKTWRVNCGSAYLLTQLCIPAMEEKRWGRVVFVSSVAGITGGIIGPHYASSKSALHGLIHWLATTYAKKGITVNGIAPALIDDTKMLPGSSDELAKKVPIGRLGTPEEIAETVLWMVKTGYVTNKVVAVDGGMLAV